MSVLDLFVASPPCAFTAQMLLGEEQLGFHTRMMSKDHGDMSMEIVWFRSLQL